MPLCISLHLRASIFTLILSILLQVLSFNSVLAQVPPNGQDSVRPSPPPPIGPGNTNNDTRNHLLCTPFGPCEPCPSDAMNEPFCQPFGNRRLMHCLNTTAETNRPSGSSPHSGTTHSIPETPAWESCGRIPAKEKADFYEFVACNVLFALVALGVLVFRERRLRLGRARVLAARIGIGAAAGLVRR